MTLYQNIQQPEQLLLKLKKNKIKYNIIFPSLFCITGPSLPYGLEKSAMAESPDRRGVLLFGGRSNENDYEKRILELRADANSWKIFNITLENGRYQHVVIPLQ